MLANGLKAELTSLTSSAKHSRASGMGSGQCSYKLSEPPTAQVPVGQEEGAPACLHWKWSLSEKSTLLLFRH